MKKGMKNTERNEVETTGFPTDHEVIEFARQNSRTKKRVEDTTGAKRKARKAKEQMQAFTINTLVYILIRVGVILMVISAASFDLIHPIVSIPVVLLCLCTVCIRFGVWLGKAGGKNA